MHSMAVTFRAANRLLSWVVVIIGLTVCLGVHDTIAFSFYTNVARYIARPWCLKECCNTDIWINRTNLTGLQQVFRSQLYGQHLVANYVPGAIEGHLSDDNPPKPLVLSFHGPTGTGKNHVAHMIVESIYKEGMASQYVTLFLADTDFPHKKMLDTYKDELRQTITKKLTSCPYQLFIFDEVEDMPEGLLGSIRPFLDYNIYYKGLDMKKAIYIFLSNTASRKIIVKTGEHFTAGHKRKDITLKEMEETIEQIAFNSEGGFAQSRLIDHNVVSHYVPFLPLEAQHVRECIRTAMRKYMYFRSKRVDEDTVDIVLRHLQFVPKDSSLFALKGCKNVVQKVILVQHQLRKEL